MGLIDKKPKELYVSWLKVADFAQRGKRLIMYTTTPLKQV